MNAAVPDRNFTVAFHGLAIQVRATPRSNASMERLFATLPSLGSGRHDVALSVTLNSRPPTQPPAGSRPTFFQGSLRAFEHDGNFLLLSPFGTVKIAAGGQKIEAEFTDEAFAQGSTVETAVFVALTLALRPHGLFHLHGGALIRADGTRVLVLGDSGAGKSTVTMSLLEDGGQRLGDDALFVGLRRNEPRLFAFPRPFHLGGRALVAFNQLAAGPVDERGKRTIDGRALPGSATQCMGAPDIVLFPRITTAALTSTRPLAMADAFGLAFPSMAMVVVDGISHRAEQLAAMRALLEPAVALELALGADWLADPPAVGARVLGEGRLRGNRGGN